MSAVEADRLSRVLAVLLLPRRVVLPLPRLVVLPLPRLVVLPSQLPRDQVRPVAVNL